MKNPDFNIWESNTLNAWHADLNAGILRGCNAWKALAKAINT